jgi:hypothetical protein
VDSCFREVQRFRQPWLRAALILPGLPMLYGAYRQFILGRPWGSRPSPDALLAILIAGYVLFVTWFLSLKLVTEVRDRELYVKFVRLFGSEERILWAQIRRVAAVTCRPARDYGGWGVRMGQKGMAYNVSGNRGVELELMDDRRLLIGSQRAEELAQAIEERRSLCSDNQTIPT